MPEYKTFNTPNDSINMEVVKIDTNTASSGISFNLENAFGTIKQVSQMMSNGMGKLPKSETPSEVEVSFYIQALDDDNMAISSNGTGNFQVKLKWGGVGGEFGDVLDLNQ
ncbi:CU044_2847 family protein [Aquimarina megaterium]|uniref:CU044_2847 family protein n=1 Tax=Aquimarina megaterium TaxID=1443666 RepID=UPI0004AD20B3|nr:CU044_2847 family protein [Aquimarina megaterium]